MATLNVTLTEQQIEAVFVTLDTNKDSVVSREELIRLVFENKPWWFLEVTYFYTRLAKWVTSIDWNLCRRELPILNILIFKKYLIEYL